MQKYIPIAVPSLGEEEWNALQAPIQTGWLTQGPKVAEFEKAFAAKHQVSYAMATTSCTTALHLALLAVGVGPGDFVVVPSFTWIATANAVVYCGAIPVFCDCDSQTYNMDMHKLTDILTKLYAHGNVIKAVIPVHLFGLCAEMETLWKLQKQYGFKIIEDAACATGAKYNGQAAGSLGDVGCFSFHPRKTVTTGEGGMCSTNDKAIAERISCLRSHGASLSEEQRHNSDRPYLMPDFNELGFNYRMTDFQGAVGVVQIGKMEQFIEERRKWASFYDDALKEIAWLTTPYIPVGVYHSYQSYVCKVNPQILGKTRNAVMQHLQEKGIGSRAGTHSVHELGYYANKYGLKKTDCPVASYLYENTLALPLHNKMTAQDYQYVVEVLRELK